VYHGIHAERDDVTQALLETKGEVILTSTRALATAYFHASCGGATSAPEDVFGGPSDAEGVSDKEGDTILCETVAKDAWTYRIKKDLLAEALGVAPAPPSVKVLKLSAFGVTYRADTFLSRVGKAFGFHHLKSAFFQVSSRGNEFIFRGRGRGHGVGLCQHGTFARAQRGDSYQKILKHYFPNHTLQKLSSL
jgi:stage II sporulation protein D